MDGSFGFDPRTPSQVRPIFFQVKPQWNDCQFIGHPPITSEGDFDWRDWHGAVLLLNHAEVDRTYFYTDDPIEDLTVSFSIKPYLLSDYLKKTAQQREALVNMYKTFIVDDEKTTEETLRAPTALQHHVMSFYSKPKIFENGKERGYGFKLNYLGLIRSNHSDKSGSDGAYWFKVQDRISSTTAGWTYQNTYLRIAVPNVNQSGSAVFHAQALKDHHTVDAAFVLQIDKKRSGPLFEDEVSLAESN